LHLPNQTAPSSVKYGAVVDKNGAVSGQSGAVPMLAMAQFVNTIYFKQSVSGSPDQHIQEITKASSC
jgi:hypothetical protein